MIRDILMAAGGAGSGPGSSLLRGAYDNTYTGPSISMSMSNIPGLAVGDLVIICIATSSGAALTCNTSGWTDHGATNYQGRFFSKAMSTSGDLTALVSFTGTAQNYTLGAAAVKANMGLTLGAVASGTNPSALNPTPLNLSGGAPYASMVWGNAASSCSMTTQSDYFLIIDRGAVGYPTVAMFFRDQMADGVTAACTINISGPGGNVTARHVASKT